MSTKEQKQAKQDLNDAIAKGPNRLDWMLIETGEQTMDKFISLVSMQHPLYDGPPIQTNLDKRADSFERLMIRAQNDGDVRPDELDEQPFPVWCWLCQTAVYRTETEDEDRPGLRIVLFAKDGRTLSSSSIALARALDVLRVTRGDVPFDPPKNLSFTSTRNRRGNITYKIDLLEDGDGVED